MEAPLKVSTATLSVAGAVLVFNWTTDHMSPLSWEFGKTFSWHPILMYFSFALLAVGSIFQFRVPGKPLPAKRNMHFMWLTPAVLCGLIGTYAAYKHHEDKNIPHFYSLHSWLGLTAVVLMTSLYCGGIPVFLLELAPPHMRKFVAPIHSMIGLSTVLLGLISILLGIMEKLSFKKGTPGACSEGTVECLKANALGCITAVLTLLVIVFWVLHPSRIPTKTAKKNSKEQSTNLEHQKSDQISPTQVPISRQLVQV